MTKYELFFNMSLANGENELYFSSINTNFVFSVNKNSGEVKVIDMPSETGMCRSIVLNRDKLYLFEDHNRRVNVFNIESRSVNTNKIPEGILNEGENRWGEHCICINDMVYFYSWDHVILKYSLKNGEWTSYRNWVDYIDNEKNGGGHIGSHAFIFNGSLYFPIFEGQSIIALNIKNSRIDIVDMALAEGEKIYFLDKHNERLFLWTNEKSNYRLYRVDIDDLKTRELVCEINYDESVHAPFVPVYTNHSVILFPNNEDKCYIIELFSGTISEIDTIPIIDKEERRNKKNGFNYCGYTTDGEYHYLVNSWLGVLVKINDETDEIETIPLRVRKEIINELNKKMIYEKGIVNEGMIKLEDLIKGVVDNYE